MIRTIKKHWWKAVIPVLALGIAAAYLISPRPEYGLVIYEDKLAAIDAVGKLQVLAKDVAISDAYEIGEQAVFSPDRQKIFLLDKSASGKEFELFSVTLEGRVEQLTDSGLYISSPNWAPDSKSIFYITENDTIRRTTLESTQSSYMFSDPNLLLFDLRISPDGNRLIYCATEPFGPNYPMAVSAGGENREILGSGRKEGVFDCEVAYSTVDRNLYSVVSDRQLFLYTAQGAHILDQGLIHEPEFSPNGEYLAYYKSEPFDDGDWHLKLASVSGGEIKDLGRGYNPSWSPSGRMLAYEDNLAPGFVAGVIDLIHGKNSILGSAYDAGWVGNNALLLHSFDGIYLVGLNGYQILKVVGY